MQFFHFRILAIKVFFSTEQLFLFSAKFLEVKNYVKLHEDT